MFERHEAADHRLLPDGEANSVAILQRESRFFVGEPELLRLWPYRRNLSRGPPWAHEFNCRVEVFPAPLIRIVHRVRGISDGKTAVIAGTVSHVRVENVVVHGVSGPQHAI